MRCKLLSTLDIKWNKFLEYMAAFDKTYTGISFEIAPYGHSSSDGKPRTFCSCGHDAAEVEDTCPVCGGQILKVSNTSGWGYYRDATRREFAAYKDGDVWKYGVFCISVNPMPMSTTQASVVMNFVSAFDLKDGRISDFNSSNYSGASESSQFFLPQKAKEDLEKYISDKLSSLGYTPEEKGTNRSEVVKAFCIQTLDNVFTKENIENMPLTMEFLLKTVSSLIGGRRTYNTAEEFPNDLDKLYDELQVPPIATPIMEQLIQTSPGNFSDFLSWSSRISIKQWDKIKDTELCKLLLSRVMHGNMYMNGLTAILNEVYCGSYSYYRRGPKKDEKWSDDEIELFIAFCKENFDVISPDFLTSKFCERVNWLQDNGVFVTEENLRTRNYYKTYNLKNFRKTLRNTDVEELIQTDPLLLISRIR